MITNKDAEMKHHDKLSVILVPMGFKEVMGQRGFFSHDIYGLFDFSATKADVRVLISEIFKRGVVVGRDQIREQFQSLMTREI